MHVSHYLTHTCMYLTHSCMPVIYPSVTHINHIPHSHMHDSFTCVTHRYDSLISVSDGHDAFTCVTHACDSLICVTRGYEWLIGVPHRDDSLIGVTLGYHVLGWIRQMCDSCLCLTCVTHAYAWHTSHDVTYGYVSRHSCMRLVDRCHSSIRRGWLMRLMSRHITLWYVSRHVIHWYVSRHSRIGVASLMDMTWIRRELYFF